MPTYKKYRPKTVLKSYVRFYFYYQCTPELGSNPPQRIVPLGNPELVIPIPFSHKTHKVSTHFDAYISSLCSKHLFTAINSTVRFIGASLYPWSIPLLLGVNTSEISDCVYSLEQVLSEFRTLVQQISEIKDPLKAIYCLENFLLNRLNSGRREDLLASFMAKSIILSKGKSTLESMHNLHTLTEKQAVERFKRSIGLPPKRFIRLVRFFNALRQLKVKENPSLTDIAYNCGYFDQSHFINDFKLFSGTTPRGYLSEQHPFTDFMLNV